MRGKVLSLPVVGNIARITPAHVGKSQQTFILLFINQDHPRTCGEKSEAAISPL